MNLFFDQYGRLRPGVITIILLVALGFVMVAYFGFIKPVNDQASTVGATVGDSFGGVVGAAVGSYKGVTEGWQKGREDGKAAGLSAEDTTVDIKSSVKELGKLEVLTASVSVKKDTVSANGGYRGFHLLLGDVTFTVDLNKAVIEDTNEGLIIVLPKPEAVLSYDEERSQKIAERQNAVFDGDAESGYIAELNSYKQIFEKSLTELENYDTLMTNAQSSAKKSIELFARSVTVNEKNIMVLFGEENEE